MVETKKADNISFPRIYSLHSQKGGVGKTSIALAIAGLAAHKHKKKTLIIDADLTGVSLCDIPGFKRIGLNHRQYFNDLLLAPPRKFEEVVDIMLKNPKQKPPKQFNENFCWGADSPHSIITILPSSSKLKDVCRILPMITQEDHLFFFRHRFEDILAFILNSGYEVVIIDFSPGLFGVSKSIFSLAMDLSISNNKNDEEYRTRFERLLYRSGGNNNNTIFQAIMCSTTDQPDYSALFGSLSDIFQARNENNMKNNLMINLYDVMQDHIWLAFNKVHGSPYDEIPPILKKSPNSSLRKLFDNQMQERGARGGSFVEKHRIEEILLATENFSNRSSNSNDKAQNKKEKFTHYYDWLDFVGRCSHLLQDKGLTQ